MIFTRTIAGVFSLVIGNAVAYAAGEHFEKVDQHFVGVLDFEARYGGYDEWVRAAWGTSDPVLEFELSDGRPFKASPTPLSAKQFTTLETGYEYPSVLVYRRIDDQRLNDWVQVLIDKKPMWLRMREGDRYTPFPSLFDQGRLAYLTSRSIRLSTHPGAPATPRKFDPQDQGHAEIEHWTPDVEVLGRAEIITYDDKTGNHMTESWLKIKVTDDPSCTGQVETIQTLAEGWIPAYRDDGTVSVWFDSRGC